MPFKSGSELTALAEVLKTMGTLSPEMRKEVGMQVTEIKNCFAFTAVADKVCIFQDLQLMRNRRFSHPEQTRNVAYAHRLLINGK